MPKRLKKHSTREVLLVLLLRIAKSLKTACEIMTWIGLETVHPISSRHRRIYALYLILNYPWQLISSFLVVIRITLLVWIICVKCFPSSEFITTKLNWWICTSWVLQSIVCSLTSSGPQAFPPPVAGVQVLFCFCSPPPQSFEHVPSSTHASHEQSVGHWDRWRIIQL